MIAKSQHQRGFTLIEVLVVIVIISIIATGSLVAFGDFGASRKAIVFAEQFSSYLKLVRQRAILEMNTLGINVTKEGYETFRFEQGKVWQAMPKNSLFHWQSFPAKVVVTLHSTIKNNTRTPDIIIQSSGDMSEFTLDFGTLAEPNKVTLVGQHNGEIFLKSAKP
jgi:general secretion pathway protein H